MPGHGDWTHTSAPYLKPRAAGQTDAWTAETAVKGRKGTQRIVHAGEVQAPQEVATLLGLPVSETVVVRQRIMLLDGEATELTNTYFPASVARGTRLAETSKIPGGAVTLLAELGHVANVVREEVCARMADDQERELLSLGPQEPVLTLTRVVLDTKDEPFQVDMTVFPAASQRLKYEMRMH